MNKIEVHGEMLVKLGEGKYLINAPRGVTIKAWISPQKDSKEKAE